jgi:cytochrome c
MFDTMMITKVGAAFCAALLIFMLGNWASSGLFDISNQGYDHVAGFSIEIEVADAGPGEEVVQVAFADIYATADAAAGERLFRQCAACHALEAGDNGVGPYLHGVVDRTKHTVAGFGYSAGLLATTGDWSPENISSFIQNPRQYAPGTAMAYNGMADIEDRANVIAYLATFSN